MSKDFVPLYERFLDDIPKQTSGGWLNHFCPFHEKGGKAAGHKTPSFYFHHESGGFRCFGCQKRGNAIDFVGLLTDPGYSPINASSKEEAIKKINEILPWFTISNPNTPQRDTKGGLPKLDQIDEYSNNLLHDPDALHYLETHRHWTTDVIETHKIGITNDRKYFTLPIFAEGDLVNVRFYSPKGNHPWNDVKPKIKGVKGRNEIRIFPDSILKNDQDKVFLVEGEADVVAALSIGLNAVAFTGGAGNVPTDLHRLREKEIVIVYDNDDAGINGAKKVANALRRFTQQIKILQLGDLFPQANDLTDAISESGKDAVFKAVIEAEKAEEFQQNNIVRNAPIRDVGFDEAINSTNIGARINLKAMVMGTRERPYAAFSRVVAECENAGSKAMCALCPLNTGSAAYPVSSDDRLSEREVLRQVRKSEVALSKELKRVCGFFCEDFTIDHTSSTIESIYELVIGPYHEESNNDESIGFSQRTVFACNNGKQYRINQPYLFEGVTIPQPWDQANTHVFTRHEQIERTVDGFELADEEKEKLRIFKISTSG